MKPYNTRKARRGRFNAFPPTMPRWGRHHRRHKSYRYRHGPDRHGSRVNGTESCVNGTDPWFSTNQKLHDGWWLSEDERRSTSSPGFLHTCFILSANSFLLSTSIFLLFAISLGIYITIAVDIAWCVVVVLGIKDELLR